MSGCVVDCVVVSPSPPGGGKSEAHCIRFYAAIISQLMVDGQILAKFKKVKKNLRKPIDGCMSPML